MAAMSASQSCAADSVSVSRTDCRSNVERLIVLSTSAVAFCRSSDSLSSRLRACTSSNKRTFSIAITAWSANVSISSICFDVNSPAANRCKIKTPIRLPSRSNGNTER